MASLFNHLLTYPKLNLSTPYLIKTSRLELPFLKNERCRSSPTVILCSSPSSSSASSLSSSSSSSSSWVERYIPESTRPYAYLMRWHSLSVGPAIFTTPCLWAISLTTEPGNIVDAKMVALFTMVGIVYRGIIVTINDILDRDVDAKVERTKKRPLASGELTLLQGLICLGVQILLNYCLLLQVNDLSRKLWFASLVLSFTYPLMKRMTYWPQAYLGLSINSFNLCGWAAVKGDLNPTILLPLCISGFFWTMVYETIYSHQDKKADVIIGVKSPALLLGNSTKIWTAGFAGACIGALGLTGSLTSIGWPYYASLAVASIHLAWQILSVDLDSPADCYKKFESNVQFGAVILCGIVFGRLYQ